MISQQDRHDAEILWDFQRVDNLIDTINNSLIIGLGSYDLRVAEHCAKLFLSGNDNHLIFTGKNGNWTRDLWGADASEASIFADVAIKSGVPSTKIILEKTATNTGQNIKFAKEIYLNHKLTVDNIIVVTKPNTTRRAYATCMAIWPEAANKLLISSPNYQLSNCSPLVTQHAMIAELVGDLERILVYPQLGFQIQQDVPAEVLAAYLRLRANGYSEHCLK